ncbi:MAG: LemA family protein [Sulfuricurvum sp. GWF2_44_89]|uniref:LemA family protein n=1 Tax=Sulfuricurvum kujiense TaxID=148813 RepID=A0A2D3WRD3_9BACT|nr:MULTISPECIES: LemA family protein [Sulfuricurvum]OHD78009.1 MAG: LemA family protein [Sulfuricurvum sp. GWF2_44_89]OHD92211.1 MAG: LemA family protein [Sulfuricurvum sp. RIFOXYD2_FULL_44_160]OHD96630.1 MAG: LemA family protein [Sulfuricurvum sp. RIFOXYD12_FULL_44_77]DAB39283.1 MAG TPA: LemA family protein [Sulfuricurvum kujiense]
MQIFLILLGILTLIAILMYNSLIGKKNQVDNIFAGVDAVLKKRFDLIPNLVASVSQYMEHEKSTLEKVTEYRAQAMKPGISDEAKIALDAKLTSALGAINIAMEAYPDLKANENVMHLQRSLSEIEEQISAARRAYNQAVTDLNNAIEMFPTNLIAGWMNLQRRAVFEITVTERQNVDVGALFNQ